jgi:hypothetical protein
MNENFSDLGGGDDLSTPISSLLDKRVRFSDDEEQQYYCPEDSADVVHASSSPSVSPSAHGNRNLSYEYESQKMFIKEPLIVFVIFMILMSNMSIDLIMQYSPLGSSKSPVRFSAFTAFLGSVLFVLFRRFV